MNRRERLERKADRRDEWAEGRDRKAEQSQAQADQLSLAIPMGQPILVGHHSEKRHRRDIEKINRATGQTIEHGKMADHHRSKADGIRNQLDRSIYRDDDDEVARLNERIAARETKQERMKAVNAYFAKRGPFGKARRIPRDPQRPYINTQEGCEQAARAIIATVREKLLTQEEGMNLAKQIANNSLQVLGFPPYALTNNAANLRKDKKRLAEAIARAEREAEE